MEAGTGTVIYEKNQDVRVSPASITKIMTLLLIYDALYNGKIQLTDEVVTSARAKSMGGSQVFLEEGEKRTRAVDGRFAGVSGIRRSADSGNADQMYCDCFR